MDERVKEQVSGGLPDGEFSFTDTHFVGANPVADAIDEIATVDYEQNPDAVAPKSVEEFFEEDSKVQPVQRCLGDGYQEAWGRVWNLLLQVMADAENLEDPTAIRQKMVFANGMLLGAAAVGLDIRPWFADRITLHTNRAAAFELAQKKQRLLDRENLANVCSHLETLILQPGDFPECFKTNLESAFEAINRMYSKE